jgi:hypothetical protein
VRGPQRSAAVLVKAPERCYLSVMTYLDWWYDANYNAARQRDVA